MCFVFGVSLERDRPEQSARTAGDRKGEAMKRMGRANKFLWMAVVCWVLVALPSVCPAKDYVVTFVKETYKTGQTEGDGAGAAGPIYHTWAVQTEFGNKLLVLTGSDKVRRQWLRDFTKDFDLFLVKVPEKDTGAFELNTVVEIDVTDLHPIDSGFLETEADAKGKKKKK